MLKPKPRSSKLFSIILVALMLASALPLFVPSAAAEGETIPLYVWDGEGSTELASEAANWYQDIGGVITNDVLPTNNSDIRFDATSVKSCTWDLDASVVTVNSLTLATGYTGTVTQGDVDIGIGAGGVMIAGGKLNANGNIEISGDWDSSGGVFIAGNSIIKFMADASLKTNGLWSGRLSNLEISDGVTVTCASNTYMLGTIRANDSVIDVSTYNLYVYLYRTNPLLGIGYSKGTTGTLILVSQSGDAHTLAPAGWTFGSKLFINSVGVSSSTVNIESDIIASNIVSVNGAATVHPIVKFNGVGLHCDRLMTTHIGSPPEIYWGDGTHRIGSLDTSAGASDFETSHIIMEQNGTVKTAAGQALHDLTVEEGVTTTLQSDVTVSGRMRVYGTLDTAGHVLTSTMEPITYTWTSASDGHYGCESNPTGSRHDALVTRVTSDGTQRHFDLGDVSNDGTASHYPAVKAKLDNLLVPYHIALGNHDHDSTSALMSTFGMDTSHYTVVDGNIAWIVLRSDVMWVSMPAFQTAYLEAMLERHDDKICFILLHMPQKRIQPGVAFSDVNNEDFIRVVTSHANHIGAVLFGHVHTPTVQMINGVHYVNVGTYGSEDGNTLGRYTYALFSVVESATGHTITVAIRDVDTGEDLSGYTATWSTVLDIVPTRITYVWDGEGATELASEAANWYQDIGGVIVNDVLPTNNSNIRYDATSVKSCTWDLDVLPYSFDMLYSYTGTVTQASQFEVGMGGFMLERGTYLMGAPVHIRGHTMLYGGVLTAMPEHAWTAGGSFVEAKATITKNTLNLVMTGQHAAFDVQPSIYALTVDGTVTKAGPFAPYMYHLNVAGRLTLDTDINVRRFGESSYENQGVIDGPGQMYMVLYDSDGYLPSSMGVVSCPVVVYASSDATCNVTMRTTGDVSLLGPLTVRSSSGTYTMTFAPSHAVTAYGLVVSTRGIYDVGHAWLINRGTIATINGGHMLLHQHDDLRYRIEAGDDATLASKPLWMAWNAHTNTLGGRAAQTGTYDVRYTLLDNGQQTPQTFRLTVEGEPSGPEWSDGTPDTDYGSIMLYVIVGAAIAFILLVFAFIGRRR